MTYLSEKQIIFLDYILLQLQLLPGVYRDNYIKHLEKRYKDFKHLLAKKIDRNDNGEIKYPTDHKFKKYTVENNLLYPSKFNIVDVLMLEYNIKKKRQYIKLQQNSNVISASDISNFTYCPVSWSISKSYKLPRSEAAQIGTSLHQDHKLINYSKLAQSVNIDRSWHSPTTKMRKFNLNFEAEEMINDISNSVVVYAGLSQEDKETHYFKGKDIYVGQPDYIFFNFKTKKYFAVEEKFHMIPKEPQNDLPEHWCREHNYNPDEINKTRNRILFYENHLNQLRSYIYGIQDYDISYGYLAYWRYTFANNATSYTTSIEQLRVKKINKDDEYNRQALIGVYKKIKKAMKVGGGEFDISKLSPSKCVGCVNYILCGHKTQHFKEYSFPYSSEYMMTKIVPFPEELNR